MSSLMKNMIWTALMMMLSQGVVVAAEDAPAKIRIPRVGATFWDKAVNSPVEWERAASFGTFVVAGSWLMPNEKTTLQLCYNQNYLFISGTVGAYALDPVSNMRDSFRADATERDGDVRKDDHVEVRFRKKNGNHVAVAINAIGAILDSKGAGHWDDSWNGSSLGTAQKGVGYWRFAMAIPLEELGIIGSPDGETLMMTAQRYDSRTEQWSEIAESGREITIEMGGNSAFARIESYDLPLSSTDAIKAKVGSARGQSLKWVRQVMRADTVIAEESLTLHADSDLTELNIASPLEGIQTGTSTRVIIYSDGNLIYRSFIMPFIPSPAEIIVTAKADVPFKLYFNGRLVGKESREIRERIPLPKGGSLLAFVIPPEGKLEVDINGPCGMVLDESGSWRAAPLSGAIPATHDETSQWQVLEGMPGSSLIEGEVASADGSPLVYAKSLLNEASILIPDLSSGICYLPAGGTLFFHWDGGWVPSWKINTPLQAPQLFVDVPQGIKFVGASGYTRATNSATESGKLPLGETPTYTWMKVGQLEREEGKYNRYVIRRDWPIGLAEGRGAWIDRVKRESEGMIFAIEAPAGAARGSAPPIYYWLEADDGSTIEYPNVLSMEISEPVEGQQPEDITITLYSKRGMIQDEKLEKLFLSNLKDAGINELIVETQTEYARDIGLGQTFYFNFGKSTRIGFGTAHVMVDDILDLYPEAHAIAFGGRVMDTPCLSWLSGNEVAWPYIEEEIAAIARRNPSMSALFWDYEFPPFPGGLHAYPMFSAYGINRFKTLYSIDDHLTPEIIRDKYHDEWVEFTCGEVANVVSRLSDISSRYGMEFIMYSGYHSDYTKRRYNVDWEKLASYIDRAYCGYTNNIELISTTREALHPVPLIAALLYQGKGVPQYTSASIIRKLIDHGGGVLLWYEGGGLDGRALTAIADASRFASRYQDYLLLGNRAEESFGLPLNSSYGIALLKQEGGRDVLLVLFNERQSPLAHKFAIPKGMKALPEDGQQSEITDVIEITLQPGTYQTFLLREI